MSGFEALFSGTLWKVLAWALVHFVWQGALIAVLLAVALAVLPRRWSHVRSLTAVSAMVLMAAAPLVTGGILWSGTTSGTESLPGASVFPVPTGVFEGAATPGDASPRRGLLSEAGFQSRVLEPWFPVIVVLWLTGVGALSLRNVGSLVAVGRLSRRGTFAPPSEWEAALTRLARRLGVRRAVRLLGSHRVAVPTVIGCLRPVILVPASAFTGLHPGELEAILAHELAHVRRFDYLVNLVQTFVETLLFYHPAVWWVSRQIRLERENCCDDIAVATCGDVRVYAEALTRMETLRSSVPDPAVGADGGSLSSRIVRLLGARSTSRRRPERWVSGTVTLLAATALGLVYLSADAPQTGAEIVSVGDSDYVSGTERGKWEARVEDDHIWLEFRWDKSNWNMHTDISGLGVSRAEIDRVLEGPAVDFEYPRDAGTFVFEGSAKHRGGRTEASGTFTFEPDPAYTKAMVDLGYDGDAVKTRQMELAAHDVTTAYVRDLADVGYEVSLNKLIEFRIHGIDTEFVKGIVAAGYRDLPPQKMVEFRIHGVEPEYVREMASAGYDDLAAQKIIEFRIHGVEPEYVREMASAGYHDLPAQKLIEFRIHGVEPEYVREMVNAGYGDLPPQKMIEFRIHGLEPEYVRELVSAGYRDLPAQKLIEFRIHGIEPEYVRALADLGYAGIPSQKLIEMKIHGVSPESVRALKERGLDDLTPDELIEIHIHGLDRALRKKQP